MKLILATGLLCGLLVQHAAAQSTITLNPDSRPAGGPDRMRTVTMTLQMTIPTAHAGSSQDMTKAIEAANQSLYAIVNQECAVLASTLDANCRVLRLGTGSNYNETGFNGFPMPGRNLGPTINANANATFEIEVPVAAQGAVALPGVSQPGASKP